MHKYHIQLTRFTRVKNQFPIFFIIEKREHIWFIFDDFFPSEMNKYRKTQFIAPLVDTTKYN